MSLAQQQDTSKSIQSLPDYHSAFNQRIIPVDIKGHQYPGAHNVRFTDNLDQTSTDFVLVDSASRNWDTEDTSRYTVFLSQELQYVHSLELVDGFVPTSGYVITDHNNTISFQETIEHVETKQVVQAHVGKGCYEITSLLNHLSTAMTVATVVGNTYKCSYSPITHKVIVTSNNAGGTGIFNLIFSNGTEVIGNRGFIDILVTDPVTGKKQIKRSEASNSRNRYIEGSIGKTIGFKPINLSGFLNYQGQMVYNLRPDEYLSLYVNTENMEDFKKVIAPSPNTGANGAFAVVQLDRDADGFDFSRGRHQIIENVRYIRTFNPPIQFSKIKIEFRTPEGHLYDFNGLDNYLLFEVKRVFHREVINRLDQLK